MGSIGLIVVAILFTSVLQRNQTGNSTREDIRARAGNPNVLQMTAHVVSVNAETRSGVVDSLQMARSDSQNLGKWTVTLASTVNTASLVSGNTVILGVDAATFNIDKHTFTALEARVLR